jgi:hypothetical protein
VGYKVKGLGEIKKLVVNALVRPHHPPHSVLTGWGRSTALTPATPSENIEGGAVPPFRPCSLSPSVSSIQRVATLSCPRAVTVRAGHRAVSLRRRRARRMGRSQARAATARGRHPREEAEAEDRHRNGSRRRTGTRRRPRRKQAISTPAASATIASFLSFIPR